MKYKRILLKLSGEALSQGDGIISNEKLLSFVDEIKSVYDLGVEIVVVIGGGNIFRGIDSQKLNLTRYKADNMGMLATVINSIALEDALQSKGMPAIVLSSIEMNKIVDFYTAQKAMENLNQGKIVICASGISNPYFSTDTGAILRAMEVKASIIFKGTQVDGVYNKDPKKHGDAVCYESISYDEVIQKKLEIMDMTAILLAQKEKLPIAIFNIHKQGTLKELLLNNKSASIIK